jgi:hypothetical protein
MLDDLVTSSRPSTLRCQIVFVEFGPGRVLLDGVATADQPSVTGMTSGVPFAIEAYLPWSKWALAVMATLERWVTEARQVDLEFRRRPNRLQVRASQGETWMLLDLLPNSAF